MRGEISAAGEMKRLMSKHDFQAMRMAMVKSQLRTSDVNDPAILGAMSAVPRENYVGEAHAGTAYHDRLISLGNGRLMNPPLVTGRMLGEAMPLPGERALVIAGGTGYVAAVLAHLVGHVTMVEQDAALVAAARDNLSRYDNVSVIEAPLADGAKGEAAFDLIFIDGAIETMSPAIVEQLGPDGRIVTGRVKRGVTQLAVGRKAGDAVSLYAFAEMEMAPLPAFAAKEEFRF